MVKSVRLNASCPTVELALINPGVQQWSKERRVVFVHVDLHDWSRRDRGLGCGCQQPCLCTRQVPCILITHSLCCCSARYKQTHTHSQTDTSENSPPCYAVAARVVMIFLGGNWNRDEGSGYHRIFKSTWVGVAVMSNSWGCWHLGNTFTNFTAQTKADAIAGTISR